jgi:hypothetical protein
MSSDIAAKWCKQANVCEVSTFRNKFHELRKRAVIDTRTGASLVKEGLIPPGQYDGRETWWRFDEGWWKANE